MKKKVMIVVGGTGGHVYPSVSLANDLFKAEPGITLMFVGGDLKNNRFFEHKKFLNESVECAPINSRNPIRLLRNVIKILKGIWQSLSIIRRFKPDLIVGFGSFHTFPTLVAAKLVGIPILLHESNSAPGKVNRLLSKHALATGIHFPETADFLKGKTIEVGVPLREGYNLGNYTKREARDYFLLDKDRITFLVFGGSQGAKKINQLVSEALSQHFEGYKECIQVLHFLGEGENKQEFQDIYDKNDIKATVKNFETRMDLAWAAADLLISRAGAATIAEQMEFEVPGVLIPYPFASDAHQDKNANFMSNTVGGSVTFLEKDLDSKILGKKIGTLLNHDRILLDAMQDALRLYKKTARQKDMCTFVLDHL